MDTHRQARNRLWSAGIGVFLGVWLVLMWAGRERMFRDPGTLWHTVVGRLILDRGEVVRADPFSIRHAGGPWLAHQWLGECMMGLVERHLGLDGLLLGACVLIAATYAWLAARMTRLGTAWSMAVALVVLAIGASSYHFMPRPHLVGLPMLALTMAVLCDVEAGRASAARLAWLPACLLVWANMHGSALGGLASLLLVIIAWVVVGGRIGARLRVESPAGSARFRGLALSVAAACAAAMLVNPFGLELPRVWARLAAGNELPDLIVEHAPLSLRTPDGWMLLGLAAAYLLALVRVRGRAWRVTWIMPILWLLLAVQRIRHGPLFAVTALAVLPDVLIAGRSIALPLSLRYQPLRSRAAALLPAVAVVALAVVLIASGVPLPVIGAGWARLGSNDWPVSALGPLRARVAEGGAAARVINDMSFGGFLIWAAPQARVWIDDRCELYGVEAIREYVEAGSDRPWEIDDWSTRHDAATALVIAGTPFDQYLTTSPHWTCLHRDARGALYARNVGLSPLLAGAGAASLNHQAAKNPRTGAAP